nr:MAG TPA: hypothetical protein [Caudoviricetes sp.]
MDFSLIGRGMKFFCRKPLKFQIPLQWEDTRVEFFGLY